MPLNLVDVFMRLLGFSGRAEKGSYHNKFSSFYHSKFSLSLVTFFSYIVDESINRVNKDGKKARCTRNCSVGV